MLQAVHRARMRDRRGAVAELRRARLADRVATLVGRRRHRRPHPQHHYLRRRGVVLRFIVLGYISGLVGASGGDEEGHEHYGAFGAAAGAGCSGLTELMLAGPLQRLILAVHYRYRCGAYARQ